jgi:hypothetical protein
MHGRRLEDLIGGLKAGVFEPGQAMGMMWDWEDQHKAKRKERKRAEQEAMGQLTGGLADLALSGDYGNVQDYGKAASATMAFAGLTEPEQQQQVFQQLAPGLESLFLPSRPNESTQDPYDLTPQSGLSRVNPSIPNQGSLIAELAKMRDGGTSRSGALTTALSRARSLYGPETFQRFAPQIEALVDDVFGGSDGGGRGF